MSAIIYGIEIERSSGIASRFALYPLKSSWRTVGSLESKATAIWVGFSFLSTSNNVFANPRIAEVLSPFELIRGFLFIAK